MAYTFRQAQNAGGLGGAAATTLVFTFDAAVLAGSLVIFEVTWNSSDVNLLTSVTDTAGNTYTIRQRTNAGGSPSSAVAYAWNVTAFTIATANFSGSVSYRGMSGQEHTSSVALSGDPWQTGQVRHQTAVGTGADGASSGTGTLTPAANNALVWGGIANTSAAGTGSSYVSAGTVGTEPANAEHLGAGAGNVVVSSEYEIQTTATARNVAFTSTVNNNYLVQMGIFLEPSSGSFFNRNFWWGNY